MERARLLAVLAMVAVLEVPQLYHGGPFVKISGGKIIGRRQGIRIFQSRVRQVSLGTACLSHAYTSANELLQQSQLRMGHLSVTNPSLVILPCGFFSPHPLF